MQNDFWKLRSSEALYLLSSRIFVAVMTIHLLSNDFIWLSSGFLFSCFMARSLSGIILSHRMEKLPKKALLMSLSVLFSGIVFATILNEKYFSFNLISLSFIALSLGFVDSFYSAVVNAFIPKVVEKTCINDAFRKTFLIQSSVDLFGIALGMTGYSILGITKIFWLILVCSGTVLVIQGSLINKGFFTISSTTYSADSIIKTLSLFFHYRFEPWWALSSMIINFFLVSFSVFMIPYVIVHISSGSPLMVGLIEGCAAIGAILSSVLVQEKIELLIGKAGTVILSFFSIGIVFLILSFTSNIIIWSILAFIMGLAIVMNNVSVEANRSIAIPEENRVKIQTVHNCIIRLGNPFGLIIIPYIVTNYSSSMALLISCIIILFVAVTIRFIPLFYELLDSDGDITDLYKRKYGDL